MDLPRVTINFIILELEQGLWKDSPGHPWLLALLEPIHEILYKAALEGSSKQSHASTLTLFRLRAMHIHFLENF